jgi:soluble lytic murein transglycosylase-like protein
MRRLISLLLALLAAASSPAAAATAAPTWRNLARTVARAEGVDPNLFAALIQTESGFRPQARSPVGAIGLAQLMPDTARDLGVNPYDPHANLRGGARHLRRLLTRYRGDRRLALAAYNAGPLAVDCYRLGKAARVGGKLINPRRLRAPLPPYPETRAYVARIERLLASPPEKSAPETSAFLRPSAPERPSPSRTFYHYRETP